ncbi:MAG: hypothetical protein ACK41Q_14800, partial [Candidatus Brocadia sp.]
ASYAVARHLEVFMKDHKQIAPFGIIIYRGREFKEIRQNIWAVPDWYLFGAIQNGSARQTISGSKLGLA